MSFKRCRRGLALCRPELMVLKNKDGLAVIDIGEME